MLDELKNFYNIVVKRVSYWLPLLFFTVLAYGFSIFNRTVGIDDLSRDYYIGSGHAMIAGTRWGMPLWLKIFATKEYVSGLERLLCVAFLMLAGIAFSAVFYYLSENKKYSFKYVIASSLLVTYPLFNEIYEYNGANLIVAGNLFIVCAAHLFLLIENEKHWKRYVVPGIVLSLVASSYESGIFVYITMVFMILFYQYIVQKKIKVNQWRWILDGVLYIIPLIIAVILRVVIGIVLLKVIGIEYVRNGSTGIYWFEGIIPLVMKIFLVYFQKGLVYLPIGVFAVSAILFAVYCLARSIKEKSLFPLIIGAMTGISIFTQAFIQGRAMPYRTAHTLMVFVAFCGLLFTEQFEVKEKHTTHRRIISNVVTVLLLFLCFRQAVCVNSILTLNNQRSENEAAIVYQIGYQLKSEFEDKTVVFVGDYDMGNYISKQIMADGSTGPERLLANLRPDLGEFEYIETNVNSYLLWAKEAFLNQGMMKEYFAYCGFDIQVMDPFDQDQYVQILDKAKQKEMKPFEIMEIDGYNVVCLGAM